MIDANYVRQRFVEAAKTECYLVVKGLRPASGAGFWPDITHTVEDLNGYGSERLAAEREEFFNLRANRPTSAQVSNFEEVLVWCIEYIPDADRRKLMKAWAKCKATGKKFTAYCKRHGLARSTANARIDKTAEDIARRLGNDDAFLFRLLGNNAGRNGGCRGTQYEKIDFRDDDEDIRSPTAIRAFEPVEIDRNEAYQAEFSKFLDETNRQRRKQQEREAARRKKLGLEAA